MDIEIKHLFNPIHQSFDVSHVLIFQTVLKSTYEQQCALRQTI